MFSLVKSPAGTKEHIHLGIVMLRVMIFYSDVGFELSFASIEKKIKGIVQPKKGKFLTLMSFQTFYFFCGAENKTVLTFTHLVSQTNLLYDIG